MLLTGDNYGQFLQFATCALHEHPGLESLETQQTLTDEELNDLRVSCQRAKFHCSTARRVSKELLGSQTKFDRDPYSLHQCVAFAPQDQDPELSHRVGGVIHQYRKGKKLDFNELALLQKFIQTKHKGKKKAQRARKILREYSIKPELMKVGDQLFLPVNLGTDKQKQVYLGRLLDSKDKHWQRTLFQLLDTNSLRNISSSDCEEVIDGRFSVPSSFVNGLAYDDAVKMIDDLKDKSIIDLGSGMNITAKLLQSLRAKSSIINVNVAANLMKNPDEEHRSIKDFGNSSVVDTLASDSFAQTTIADFWTHLDQYDIPEKSIDRVVSYRAFPLYANSRFEVLKVLQDLHNYLKDDGQLRLGPILDKAPGDQAASLDMFEKIAQKAGFYIADIHNIPEYENQISIVLQKSLSFTEE